MRPPPPVVSALAALVASAVLAAPSLAQTFRDTRPVRGAWLRPPSTIASLEVTLVNLARAGVTDLYLETFYHGVATNDSDVFGDRFAFDYLEDAMTAAARYNIRVYAWCESGYWQFGSTGAANFTANPEWRAINTATGTFGGDGTAGQVFANLAHPGVQQKMRDYFAELAAYDGLWGVQTDYHRYPLDNNTGDSFTAPWSYDTYMVSAFQAAFGSDPTVTARTPAGSQWNNFLAFRRNGISEAARQMKLGIDGVDAGVDFSAAMFAVPELTKCQQWQVWATNGYIDTLVPMAYGFSSSAITTDLNTTKASAAGRRVIAGLALGGTHPTVTTQLVAARNAAIQDFIFFEGNLVVVPATRDAMKFWLLNNAQVQKGDFNADGYVDSRDYALFDALYTGTPIPATGANARYDLTGDALVTGADRPALARLEARFRFGEDGVVQMSDLRALRRSFGATAPVAGIQHLYDLEGDGDVDTADERRAWTLLLTRVSPPTLDANADGVVSIDDLAAHEATPADVDGNGRVGADDRSVLLIALRAGERDALLAGR